MDQLMDGSAIIRRAGSDDWAAAYRVCVETGDAGSDGTALYQRDPESLGHLYVGPYLKFSPEFAFVLEDDGGVCGYALGALDSEEFMERYVREWLPGLRATHPEPGGNPEHWDAVDQVYYEYYHPDLFLPEPRSDYPSHLHIDLMLRVQGRGWGKRMMSVLLDGLEKAGSKGVFLAMAPSNQRAERFYKKLGFGEIARRASAVYLGRKF